MRLNIASFEAVVLAWQVAYSGTMHRILCNNINRMEHKQPHTNCVSIIQSSGTGKSRMVHEQALLVFTIPFNLQDSKESRDGRCIDMWALVRRANQFISGYAYPPPDVGVRSHLLQAGGAGNSNASTSAYYLQFLASIFQVAATEVLACGKHETYAALATAWRAHLSEPEGEREKLHSTAIEIHQKLMVSFCPPVVGLTNLKPSSG